MTSEEIRDRFLSFFERRGHKIIPSASLVPENDPSVLFNTAGMQPLVPYLMGEKHPSGDKLVNFQKCVRTNDIDEVGDNTHLTFFEMLGNWSLGAYFKDEAISWSWELLTNKEEGFGLDPNKLYVTCFAGDENAPRDEYSAEIWRKLFTAAGINADHHIFFLPADKNWWSPGDNGPCGPDTEMYYDVSGDAKIKNLEDFKREDDSQKIVEIWNNVFMEYEKKDGKVIGKLKQQNVDTGSGLERITTVIQGKDNVYDTDLFSSTLLILNQFAPTGDRRTKRIIADHIRTAVFMVSDGVVPSNTDRGYILRRIIRRAIRYFDKLYLNQSLVGLGLVDAVIKKYQEIYPNLRINREIIKKEINQEEERFRKTLTKGMREFEKIEKRIINSSDNLKILPGKVIFDLYQTYGFPIELTEEMAREKNITIDKEGFAEELKKHQDTSRTSAKQKFKGGLAATSAQTIKYHTATHLLQQALVDVLGPQIEQRGSNITDERLRFDFAFDRKMTDEEKKRVEDIVNEKIAANLPVQKVILPKAEAEKSGARHLFSEKYGDEVSVYFIGDSLETAYSKEFCGGPHVANTGELASNSSGQRTRFKIIKEEAVAAGIRRIKAILE
jgi:alanyl-tRNA synthetase